MITTYLFFIAQSTHGGSGDESESKSLLLQIQPKMTQDFLLPVIPLANCEWIRYEIKVLLLRHET